jgi:hypothetical protein
MNKTQNKIATLLLAAVLGQAGALHGKTPHGQQSFPVVSDNTFRSDNQEYEYKSSVLRARDLWTVVGVRAHGQLAGPQQYHLWRIDVQGRKLRDIDLTAGSVLDRSQKTGSPSYGLITLNNGKLGLFVGAGGETIFVAIDPETGEAASPQTIKGLPSGSFISKVLQDTGGSVFLMGRSVSRGLLVKLDNRGEIQDSFSITDPDVTVLTDGVSLPDRTFVLLGEHLDDSGKTTLWLARVTEKGEVLQKTKFSGQGGSISCVSASRCGIIYAVPGTDGWRVLVRATDETLATVWETEIQSGLRINPQWRVMAGANGRFLVAGGNAKQRLWVGALSKEGALMSSRVFEEPSAQWQRLWNFDLLPAEQELVIPFTELLVGKELDQRQVVKLLRTQMP